MKHIFLSFMLLVLFKIQAQTDTVSQLNKLPYDEIPDYPADYSAGNVTARVVDGLGYRYYWATEGLRDEDYHYKASEDSRTIGETMQHIFGLTRTTTHVVKNEAIERKEDPPFTPMELRKKTLENIQAASKLLKGKTAEDLETLSIVFKRADRTSEFPFWNLLNGQLSDAIYHTGQIVAFRRAAGNPVDFRMNVFTGKNRQ